VTARIGIFLAAFVAVMGTLILFPGIDLWVSGFFYQPGVGFSHSALLDAIHGGMPFLVAALILGSVALLLRPGRRRAPPHCRARFTRRCACSAARCGAGPPGEHGGSGTAA